MVIKAKLNMQSLTKAIYRFLGGIDDEECAILLQFLSSIIKVV